jgi:hypothetical protein|tara:strand:- start:305 stop:481 length:177 start_codon:yes stop_codon:yes gene_type:complete
LFITITTKGDDMTAKKVKDYFYYLCEHYGGKVSSWGWHKRWNRRKYKPHKHYLRGESK